MGPQALSLSEHRSRRQDATRRTSRCPVIYVLLQSSCSQNGVSSLAFARNPAPPAWHDKAKRAIQLRGIAGPVTRRVCMWIKRGKRGGLI